MSERSIILASETETLALAERLAQLLKGGMVVSLRGDLGAGKTTFCRGLIQALGHQGTVKSPTYTLVEPYELKGLVVYHFDLYRLHDPEELEFMGFRDYFNSQSLCLIEWPQRGAGLLPVADIDILLKQQGEQRLLSMVAGSEQGQSLITILMPND